MSGTDNLGLPQMDDSTQGKSAFLNDITALIDQTITASLGVNAAANAALTSDAIKNFAKIVAESVPAGGTTVTLGPVTRTMILSNDAASAGTVTFQVGSAAVTVQPGKIVLVYLDGTVNGLSIVSSPSLRNLVDVDLPANIPDGYALTYNATEGKWNATAASGGGGGGGNTEVSYTSWRVIFDTVSGGQTAGIGQIVFKDASGTVIQSNGGTPSASSNYGGSAYSDAYPFDGSPPDNAQHVGWYAASHQTTGEWIAYTFGAAKAVASVTMLPCGDTTGPADAPATFRVQGSNDGSTWNNVGSELTAAAWATGVSQTFVVQEASSGGGAGGTQISARYWRLAHLDNIGEGQFVGTGELQFFDQSGTIIASSNPFSAGDDTDPLIHVNDGDLTTYWTTNRGDSFTYVGLDLGAGATPHSFLISARNGNTACNIKSCSLEYSADKVVWFPLASYAVPAWAGTDSETKTLPIPPHP